MDPVAFQALQQQISGLIDSTALPVAAEIGVADRLAGRTCTAEELAAELGLDASALARLLRLLAGRGIVRQAGAGRWTLAPMGEFLRSDVEGSQRGFLRIVGHWLTPALLHGKQTMTTGGPCFETAMGLPAWAYLEKNPDLGAVFNIAMTEMAGAVSAPALAGYDWSQVSHIVDIGGGRGQLVRTVLARNPHLCGTILDQPHVIAEAEAAITADGLSDRCQAVPGDFFTAVPAADCYTLRWIIHDWSDAEALAILSACRASITPGGRLLLFEIVLPDDDAPGSDQPHPARSFDWIMLTYLTGRERTEAQYAALLARAGFRLARVIPQPAPMSILEAYPIEP